MISRELAIELAEKAGFEHINHIKYRGRYNRCTVGEKFEIDCFQRLCEIAAAQEQRKPLSIERLREIERDHVYSQTATLVQFARAIEAAHGIGEQA